jgi:hypothetical protein
MNDTPSPMRASNETLSATYRKGQMSVVAKVLVGFQIVIVPTVGWLVSQWSAQVDDINRIAQRVTVSEVKLEQAERGNSEKFAEVKSYLQRLEEKLDRLLLERRP